MDEDSSTEQKTWQVYSFGKRNVFRLHSKIDNMGTWRWGWGEYNFYTIWHKKNADASLPTQLTRRLMSAPLSSSMVAMSTSPRSLAQWSRPMPCSTTRWSSWVCTLLTQQHLFHGYLGLDSLVQGSMNELRKTHTSLSEIYAIQNYACTHFPNTCHPHTYMQFHLTDTILNLKYSQGHSYAPRHQF